MNSEGLLTYCKMLGEFTLPVANTQSDERGTTFNHCWFEKQMYNFKMSDSTCLNQLQKKLYKQNKVNVDIWTNVK